jgi:hypothetical protein
MMQSRQTLLAVVVGVLILAIAGYWWLSGSSDSQSGLPQRAFYSVDDGKTWFEDSASQIAPFDHSGKEAVRAYVFTSDGGKTKWVGYLERCTAQAKTAILNARNGKGEPEEIVRRRLGGGVEVKKPNDTKWVPISDAQGAAAIMQPKSPTGATDGVQPVEP